jgi:hypothetical protein
MSLAAYHLQLKARTDSLERQAQQTRQRLDLARAEFARCEQAHASATGALGNHRFIVAEIAERLAARPPATPAAAPLSPA